MGLCIFFFPLRGFRSRLLLLESHKRSVKTQVFSLPRTQSPASAAWNIPNGTRRAPAPCKRVRRKPGFRVGRARRLWLQAGCHGCCVGRTEIQGRAPGFEGPRSVSEGCGRFVRVYLAPREASHAAQMWLMRRQTRLNQPEPRAKTSPGCSHTELVGFLWQLKGAEGLVATVCPRRTGHGGASGVHWAG